jgi:hypothetical protein
VQGLLVVAISLRGAPMMCLICRTMAASRLAAPRRFLAVAA